MGTATFYLRPNDIERKLSSLTREELNKIDKLLKIKTILLLDGIPPDNRSAIEILLYC